MDIMVPILSPYGGSMSLEILTVARMGFAVLLGPSLEADGYLYVQF